MWYKKIVVLLIITSFCRIAHSQILQIDTTFNSTGIPVTVNSITKLRGHKIILNHSVTLDTNGGIGKSFFLADGKYNGKILLEESNSFFFSYDNVNSSELLRLTNSNVLDLTFKNKKSNGTIEAIIPTTDNMYYVVGHFTEYGGFSSENIVRIFSNGDVDINFKSKFPVSFKVTNCIVLENKKIVTIGSVGDNSTNSSLLYVFKENGTYEKEIIIPNLQHATFQNIFHINNHIYLIGPIAYIGNEKIFTMIKLSEEGTVEDPFQNLFFKYEFISKAILTQDSSFILTGYFNPSDTLSKKSIKVDTTGNQINDFILDSLGDISISDVIELEDGSLVFGGDKILFRTDKNGHLLKNYTGSIYIDGEVNIILNDSSDHIYIIGNFNHVQGEEMNYIARLNRDGSLDRSFKSNINNSVFNIKSAAIQPDGKIILGVIREIHVNGKEYIGIVRLNQDGSLDTTFNNGGSGFGNNLFGGPWEQVLGLVAFKDGKILVGGRFAYYNSSPRLGLLRLNEDGSLDETFNTLNKIDGVTQLYYVDDTTIVIKTASISPSTITIDINGQLQTGFVGLNGLGYLDNLIVHPVQKTLYINDGSFSFNDKNDWLYDYNFGLFKTNYNGTLDITFKMHQRFFNSKKITGDYIGNDILLHGKDASISSNLQLMNSKGETIEEYENFLPYEYVIKNIGNDRILVAGYFKGYKNKNLNTLLVFKYNKLVLLNENKELTDLTPTAKLFPNPSERYVQASVSEPSDVIFYSPEGQALFSTHVVGKETKIDISQLKQGIILYSIEGKGIKNHGKIIVR